jgi:hypothetical protein
MLSITSAIFVDTPQGMAPAAMSEPAAFALVKTHPQNPCRWVGPGKS